MKSSIRMKLMALRAINRCVCNMPNRNGTDHLPFWPCPFPFRSLFNNSFLLSFFLFFLFVVAAWFSTPVSRLNAPVGPTPAVTAATAAAAAPAVTMNKLTQLTRYFFPFFSSLLLLLLIFLLLPLLLLWFHSSCLLFLTIIQSNWFLLDLVIFLLFLEEVVVVVGWGNEIELNQRLDTARLQSD